MGRRRTIGADQVLDAAQRVVIRDGAARLTLDAVAAEASISKASVLYDYKTKQALLKAVVERRLSAEKARERDAAVALEGRPNAAILARLAMASEEFSDEDRSVAVNVVASVAQDATLRIPLQELVRERLAAVERTAEHPRGCVLAFLALEGLLLLDWLGLHSWSACDRRRLLADIAWLAEQQPAVEGNDPPSVDDLEQPAGGGPGVEKTSGSDGAELHDRSAG